MATGAVKKVLVRLSQMMAVFDFFALISNLFVVGLVAEIRVYPFDNLSFD
jgi:hypothetical protein